MTRIMDRSGRLTPGTWFQLPLPSGGYALGLIVRRAKGPIPRIIFCYFFGPRLESWEQIQKPIALAPSDRIFFARTNDRAFKTNRWIVLDDMKSFDPNIWSMPPFRSGAVGGGPDHRRRRYLRTYNDQFKCVAEELQVVDRVEDYPQDIDFGHLAMEQALDRVLVGTYEDH